MNRFVLASGSPRRHDLLRATGYRFSVATPDVDEVRLDDESPTVMVERLARAKASAVVAGDAVVLAADTIVVLGDQVLGKPTNPTHACEMLAQIAGTSHTVVTGFCIAAGGETICESVSTDVTMAPMTTAEIDEYVATGEPLDKAGSYAYQGIGRRFVVRVVGSRTNVIGLPLEQVAPALDRFDVYPSHPIDIAEVERSIFG